MENVSNKMLKSPENGANKNHKGATGLIPHFCFKDPQCCRHLGPRILENPNTTCQSKLLCWILSRCPLEYPTARCWHPPHVQHLFRSSSSIIRINGIWIICVPGSFNSLHLGIIIIPPAMTGIL